MQHKSLKQNLIYNTLYQITVLILPFITAPYVSRVIGANGLGMYSYNHSVALYFVYFAMLGLANYGNREISKNCDDRKNLNKKFSSIYFLQIITSAIITCLYVIYLLIFNNKNLDIGLIMCLHIFSSFFDVSWLFFGLQEFKITSIRQMLIKLISVTLIFVFVKNRNDLWIYTIIMSMSYFLSAFSLWVFMFKKVKIVKCSCKEIFENLKPSLVLFIPIIATSVYRIMDKIMIGNFSSMSDVGYYENAEKIIMISLGILNAFCAVIMPKIVNLLSNQKKNEARELFDKSMKLSTFICFAIAFGIATVAYEFIPIFFGNDFLPSIKICIMLCLTVPFITWSTMIRNLYLIPYEKDNIYVNSIVIGAILNFIINFICIPKFGVMGAVIGTTIAEIAVALYQTWKIKREINLNKYLKYVGVFFCLGAVMFITVYFIKKQIIDNSNIIIKLFMEITTGASVYLFMSMIYIIRTEGYNIKRIIKKRGE